MKDYCVIILCGGKSSRMGYDKAMLSISGETFLQHIEKKFLKECDVYLAIGSGKEYEGVQSRQISDIYTDCGPLAGIQAVMKECEGEIFYVAACDMPFIDIDFADTLYACMKADPSIDAVVPIDRAGRMHTLGALYRKRIYPYIIQALENGDYKVRNVLEKVNVKYMEISEDLERKLINVNTREDYRKYFTTRQYVFMALCSVLGLFSKRLVSPAANIVTDLLHIPGGIGTGFSIMFIVIAAVICDKFGSATVMCIIQSGVALSLGMIGSMGILSPIGYIVPGMVIDLFFLLAKRLHLTKEIRIVTANAIAAASASFTANIIVFRLHGIPLLLYIMVSLTGGSIFGLLGCELAKRLYPVVHRASSNL